MFEDPSLAALYPRAADVPEAMRVRADDHGACMLIDGVVRRGFARDRQAPVFSRVGVREGEDLQPVLLGHEARVTAQECGEALAAADRAFAGGTGEWPAAKPEVRIAAVERFAAAVERAAERIAMLLVHEIGKPLASARAEVTRSLEYIKDTIAEVRRLGDHGNIYTGINGKTTHHARDLFRPLGKVLCVAPFNYPINEFLTTIVPALLAGNVVIAKTPRFGVLANQLLMDAFAEAFPRGVVALLPGDGRIVLPALVRDRTLDVFGHAKGSIDVLAFIGSEQAANAILSQHPTPSFVHKILGLGAKNAAVVLPGADIADAAQKLAKGALGFNGQRCTAEKIIFAPAGAEGDALVAAIAQRVVAMKVGMPWDDGVAITPLPEHGKLEAMWKYVADATAQGARVVNDGGGRGWFSLMRPAVLDRVAPGMRIYDEEQFGPIVPVVRYGRTEEVIAWHLRSPYGQQAGVYGPDGAERRELVSSLAAFVARVNINDVCQRGPDTFGFTAADKSGFGTLSIAGALRSFSRTVIMQSPDRGAIA